MVETHGRDYTMTRRAPANQTPIEVSSINGDVQAGLDARSGTVCLTSTAHATRHWTDCSGLH